mmetsp:Transcript_71862/g.112426  ORF Transcript_71862/g.112426 Transcript_71862/m.112426 type:complete len:277 (-) Transcript_71862:232-1062(-)
MRSDGLGASVPFGRDSPGVVGEAFEETARDHSAAAFEETAPVSLQSVPLLPAVALLLPVVAPLLTGVQVVEVVVFSLGNRPGDRAPRLRGLSLERCASSQASFEQRLSTRGASSPGSFRPLLSSTFDLHLALIRRCSSNPLDPQESTDGSRRLPVARPPNFFLLPPPLREALRAAAETSFCGVSNVAAPINSGSSSLSPSSGEAFPSLFLSSSGESKRVVSCFACDFFSFSFCFLFCFCFLFFSSFAACCSTSSNKACAAAAAASASMAFPGASRS